MIAKAIFDSGVFIGSQYTRDQYASQAVEILRHFKNKEIVKIFITDYVVVETVNFIIKKVDFEKAKVMHDLLLNTENIEIYYMDDSYMKRVRELFNKYKNLSITDCSLIALSEKLKIKEIFSFDKHFDAVNGIRRLASI